MGRPSEDELIRTVDRSGGEQRAEALRRLGATARGREALAKQDPSRLFALLGAEPIPGPVLDRVSVEVSSAIRRETDRSGPARGRRWIAAGALAAGLALAALLGVELNRPLDQQLAGLPPIESGAPPVSGAGSGDRTRPGLALRVSDGSAQVFDLAVGDVQVVMIFDERLEL